MGWWIAKTNVYQMDDGVKINIQEGLNTMEKT
jgi:hypothetical protein